MYLMWITRHAWPSNQLWHQEASRPGRVLVEDIAGRVLVEDIAGRVLVGEVAGRVLVGSQDFARHPALASVLVDAASRRIARVRPQGPAALA
jgi:hypothetical protein